MQSMGKRKYFHACNQKTTSIQNMGKPSTNRQVKCGHPRETKNQKKKKKKKKKTTKKKKKKKKSPQKKRTTYPKRTAYD